MKSNARFVRGAVIVSLVLAAVLVAGIGGYMTKRPQMLHAETCTAAANGEYEQATESLSRLRECGNDALYYETVLTIAETADVNGDFDIALELLAVPVESEDEVYTDFVAKANALAEVCTYHQAQALFEAGEYAKAARMAASVREYEPALELYQQAERAYQADQPTLRLRPFPRLCPWRLNSLQRLMRERFGFGRPIVLQRALPIPLCFWMTEPCAPLAITPTARPRCRSGKTW